MDTQNIKWYKNLNFKGTLLLFFVVTVLVIGMLIMMNTQGRKLVLDESSRLIEQIGNNMVSDLNARTQEIAALTRTMGTMTENLSKSEDVFKEVFPDIIDFQRDTDIAGGGVWPEPYAFDPSLEKRSFFWGRDTENNFQYYDDYNLSETGYHHEEWYVVARHLEYGRCSWSKSYMDPFSLQPMVTATIATYESGRFSGTVTIDLKLEGLQAFAEYWQKKTGGYVFITDQYNTFITFPNPSLVRSVITDEEGNETQESLTASEFAEKEPRFLPIANILEEMNRTVREKAGRMPGYKPEIVEQIDQDSYQIKISEAELIAAIVADPFVRQSFYKRIEIEDDFMNDEQSFVYTFYVPQSYWKVVIVKPFSEATAVVSDLFQLLIRYLAITVIVIMVIGYLLFDRLLIQPLTLITDSVKAISKLVTEEKLSELKYAKIPQTSSDELGVLSTCVNSLVSELEHSYQQIATTKEQLQQQIEEHQAAQKALLNENRQLKSAVEEQIITLQEQQHLTQTGQTEELQRIIHQQQEVLKQCEVPVIQIWEGIVIVSQIGTIDGDSVSRMLSHVSTVIEKERAKYVIINMSGMPVVDAKETGNYLIKLVQAVKLLGTECILIGIPVKIAEVLVDTGTDGRQILAFSRIEQGVRWALSQMHVEVLTTSKEVDTQ